MEAYVHTQFDLNCFTLALSPDGPGLGSPPAYVLWDEVEMQIGVLGFHTPEAHLRMNCRALLGNWS